VILGGVGFVHGAVLGRVPDRAAADDLPAKDYMPANVALRLAGGGIRLVLIVFIIFEPLGLYGRWLKVRTWLELFPFYRRGMFRRQKSYMKSERLR
jgi:branched-chain amino acid transport system permease protein